MDFLDGINFIENPDGLKEVNDPAWDEFLRICEGPKIIIKNLENELTKVEKVKEFKILEALIDIIEIIVV